MDVVVRPSGVSGRAAGPPAKSDTHRALIATALAGGGHVDGPLDSADTRATGRAITHLGADVDWTADSVYVDGFPSRRPLPADDPIDCTNSGTTLRFAIALTALAAGRSRLTGDRSLRHRPNGPLLEAIDDLGGTAESDTDDGRAPLTVEGPIAGGTVELPGSISSQFISSLLMVGGRTDLGIDIELTSPLVSRPYVDLTRAILDRFGVDTAATKTRFAVAGRQPFTFPSAGLEIGADPTAVSCLLAAGVLAGDPGIEVEDVGRRGNHPAPILGILRAMALPYRRNGSAVTVERATPTAGHFDLGNAPDLLPTVAILASRADGTSTLEHINHARYKESDRIATTASFLRRLGVPVTERSDGLLIRGQPGGLVGGTIDSHGDHRIAMAAALAGLVADGPVRITRAECVAVSFPDFFETLEHLGGEIERVE